MKNESSFSQAEIYTYWQGFASKELMQSIEDELAENEATCSLLNQVKKNQKRWLFLELPKEPIPESLVTEIYETIFKGKDVSESNAPEFGQLWSVKGLGNRYVVIVYFDPDDGTDEVIRAVLLSNQIQYATKFDLIIEPAYLPVKFRKEFNIDRQMMIESWNDFPMLRSQLDICYGSFSHKTQHFLNEMMMAHHRYEMGGSESKSGLSLLDSPEIIGHSRGQGIPNDTPAISMFQLKEIEVPQPLFDEVAETLGFFEETEEEKSPSPVSFVRDFLVKPVISIADFTQRLLARTEYQQALMAASGGKPSVTVIAPDERELMQKEIADIPTPPTLQKKYQRFEYTFDILDLPPEYEGADFVVLYRYHSDQEWEVVFKGKVDNRGRIYVRIPVEDIPDESGSIEKSFLDYFEVRIFSS